MPRKFEEPNRQNKIQTISRQLREQAHKRGPEAKMPTVREICAQYGVSKTTVEDALETLENANIIFRRQGSGIFVSSTLHRKFVTILVNSYYFQTPSTSPFWGRLLFLLTQEAQRRASEQVASFSFHMVAASHTTDDPLVQNMTRLVEANQVHGALLIGIDIALAEWLQDRTVPTVAFAGPARWSVAQDYSAAIHQGVGALISQGCRRIGCLDKVALPGTPTTKDPHLPFRTALKAHGVPYEERWVRNSADILPHQTLQEYGYASGMALFGASDRLRPDGIISMDDMVTSGLLAALHQLDLHPGTDVRIATHANAGSSTLGAYGQHLTRMEFDTQDIVQEMFSLLEEAWEDPNRPEQIKWMAPRLVSPDQEG